MNQPSTVAVIGAGKTISMHPIDPFTFELTEYQGSAGLSMLKTLREDGFKVTCYERRSQVGGLWAWSDKKEVTSALKSEILLRKLRVRCSNYGIATTANISKYTCGMSDFPMPDGSFNH